MEATITLDLTEAELLEIARYTVQKIQNYPQEYGKTVENYFSLLFPDEVNNYIMRREINRRGTENLRLSGERRTHDG